MLARHLARSKVQDPVGDVDAWRQASKGGDTATASAAQHAFASSSEKAAGRWRTLRSNKERSAARRSAERAPAGGAP